MIRAIVQVPERLPIGSLLNGAITNSFGEYKQGNIQKIVNGRDIQVPPLHFYKVYSVWNDMMLEHTFVCDEYINPMNLCLSMNSDTWCVSNHPSWIIPISVKVMRGLQTACFLFAMSIDYLLSQYRFGIPFVAMKSPCFGMIPQSSDSIVRFPAFNGVISASRYIYDIYAPLFGYIGHGRRELPIPMRNTVDLLTAESPKTVYEVVQELSGFINNPDALYSYIDDVYEVASGLIVTPEEIVEHYLYPFPFDPITLHCISRSAGFFINELTPFIRDANALKNYLILANSIVAQTENVQIFDLLSLFYMNDYYGFLILDEIINAPFTDIVISCSKDRRVSLFTKSCVFPDDLIYHSRKDKNEAFREVCGSLYSLFLEWRNHELFNQSCNSITLTKTWLDELFIQCEMQDGSIKVGYLNLALYHLTSPCLIDTSRRNKPSF